MCLARNRSFEFITHSLEEIEREGNNNTSTSYTRILSITIYIDRAFTTSPLRNIIHELLLILCLSFVLIFGKIQ